MFWSLQSSLTLPLKSFFPKQTSEDESSEQSLFHHLGDCFPAAYTKRL